METQVEAVEVEEVVELLDAELDLIGGEGMGSSAKETRIETTKEVEAKEVEVNEVEALEIEVQEVEVIELPVIELDRTRGRTIRTSLH